MNAGTEGAQANSIIGVKWYLFLFLPFMLILGHSILFSTETV
jgi:hypothetical protein